MISDLVSVTPRENHPSRRQALAALGAVTSASTVGCNGVLPSGNTDSSDEVSEVVVENRTTSQAQIAVHVAGDEDETLFSQVFVLGADKMSGRGAINTTPERIHAFTATGASHTWQYDPDLPVEFACNPKDIGLTLSRDNTINPWYDC